MEGGERSSDEAQPSLGLGSIKLAIVAKSLCGEEWIPGSHKGAGDQQSPRGTTVVWGRTVLERGEGRGEDDAAVTGPQTLARRKQFTASNKHTGRAEGEQSVSFVLDCNYII